MNTYIDIKKVLELEKEIRKINAIPFDQIVWMKNMVSISTPQEVIDNFKFTGLNNMDFITSGYYKKVEA